MVGNVIPTCTMCTDNIFASDVTFFSCRWEVVGVNSGCTRCSSVSRNHIAGGHRENHMGLLCKTVRYSIFFFLAKIGNCYHTCEFKEVSPVWQEWIL